MTCAARGRSLPRATIAGAGLCLLALTPPGLAAQDPSDWSVVGAVYGWLAGVDGTVAVGRRTEFPVDVPFNDILENVDVAFSAHLEARQAGGWTLLGDLFYADLGLSGTVPGSQTEVTLDQEQTVLEGAVGYEIVRDLEILGALRYNELDVSASTPENETDERGANWLDGFAGVRFTPSFGDRWLLDVRADVGGGGRPFPGSRRRGLPTR